MSKEKRHMVNILNKHYEIISEYCRPRNLIIGKWMSSICIDYIQNNISGSTKKFIKE